MEKVFKGDTAITPPYYNEKLDPFTISDMYHLNCRKGTALKYILRAGKKYKNKEVEDLEKAIKCLQLEIDTIKKKGLQS